MQNKLWNTTLVLIIVAITHIQCSKPPSVPKLTDTHPIIGEDPTDPTEPTDPTQVPDPKPYASSILEEDLRTHLEKLASPELKGRGTGTSSKKQAAKYLANQFEKMGLQPLVTEDDTLSYFQQFQLEEGEPRQATIDIDNTQKYTHFQDILWLSNNDSQPDWVSYDLLLPSNISIDLSGKLLTFSETSISTWQEKIAIVRSKHASGAIIFVEDEAFNQALTSFPASYHASNDETIAELIFALPASSFQNLFGVDISNAEHAAYNECPMPIELHKDQDRAVIEARPHPKGSAFIYYEHLRDMLWLSNNGSADWEFYRLLLKEPERDTDPSDNLISLSAESIQEWQEKATIVRNEGAIGAILFIEDNVLSQEIQNFPEDFHSPDAETTREVIFAIPASFFHLCFGINISDTQRGATRSSVNIDFKVFKGRSNLISENVIAYVEGTTKKDEVLILTAHYDHLGVQGGHIYPGADDNSSGTAALLEIAEAFAMAKAKGHLPLRSVLFMATGAEEIGLIGSAYYVENPLFPISQTVANLNMDMISRPTPTRQDEDYVYLIGSDRLSSDLHHLSENTNQRYTKLKLDYTYNATDHPLQLFYRSDQFNFAKKGIPVIFYTSSGGHPDYHQPTDTPDKVVYSVHKNITTLVFYTAWEIAHRKERPKIDPQRRIPLSRPEGLRSCSGHK